MNILVAVAQGHGSTFQQLFELTRCLIVVDVDPLQLEVRVAMVGTSGVNTVLIRDHLPELENTNSTLKVF